eukprot:scaffold18942_cov63-Phaeocystis_antarctica.AAC.2
MSRGSHPLTQSVQPSPMVGGGFGCQTCSQGAAAFGGTLQTSQSCSRPPGLSTRKALRKAASLSTVRLKTPLLMQRSAPLAATTPARLLPSSRAARMNSALPPNSATVASARCSISWVQSTPITLPDGPTILDARRQSWPAPQPRSTTTSPWHGGFPSASISGQPPPHAAANILSKSDESRPVSLMSDAE